jgi:hypothetical protein
MHVLMTSDTLNGNIWTYTRELISGLIGRGMRVTLVSFGEIPLPEQTAWMERLRGLDGCEVCVDERPETIGAALMRALRFGRRTASRERMRALDENSITERVISVYRSVLAPNGNKSHRKDRAVVEGSSAS